LMLKQITPIPEVKARIEELTKNIEDHNLYAIDKARNDAIEQAKEAKRAEEYPNLAALNPTPNPRGQGELFGPEEAPPSKGLPLGAPISQLPPTQEEAGAENVPKGAYQYKLAARKNQKVAPFSTPETTAAEPIPATQPITTDDIKRTGVPLRSTLPWFTTNVVGKTQPQVQELVSKQPDLVQGQDPRAQILRAILTAPIPTFQEAQNVQPASTTQPTTEPRLEPRLEPKLHPRLETGRDQRLDERLVEPRLAPRLDP
jgi:hypothetical protein